MSILACVTVMVNAAATAFARLHADFLPAFLPASPLSPPLPNRVIERKQESVLINVAVACS